MKGQKFTRIIPLLMAVVLMLFSAVSYAQTTLTTGDLAFIGLNSDGNDEFSAVLLKDITSGTSFYITDKGWNDATGFLTILGDGIWQWTATSALSAGTIIHVKTTNNGNIEVGSLAANPGTVSWVENNGTVISYTGDQLFLYQGTAASPVIIAGIHWNVEAGSSSANWDGSASSAQTSALPDQLSTGTNATWLYGAGPTEYDNFMYNKANGTSGGPAEIRAKVCNISNWLVDTTNSTAYTIDPFDPTSFTVTAAATTPSLTTTAASSITVNSAIAGGNVTNDGGATITARGVCWNTTANPTISNPHTTESGTTGSFTSSITGLSPGITYHYRSYATNSQGTDYGVDLSFTTVPSNPESVTISNTATEVTVSWNAVIGASSYKVYYSTDPYTGFIEDTSGSYNGSNWTAPFVESKKFYYVVAVN